MGENEGENSEEKKAKKPRHRKKQLFKSILQQMEFYFSDSNLSKDRYLSQLLNEDPYVNLDVFLKFNKIRKLGCTIHDIRKAITKSDLIELSEDSEKVRRKQPLKVKQNVDECTIYVENIPAEADHDRVKQVFMDLGNVVYVSIPKYKHNRMNKGFAFVEFETEKEAKNALDFFESIGCRMSLEKDPEQLQSIATFEGNLEQQESGSKSDVCDKKPVKEKEGVLEECNEKKELESDVDGKEEKDVEVCDKKRKLSTDEDSAPKKKAKIEGKTEETNDKSDNESGLKKKNKKKEKKKSQIKEMGLQVLSKKEWKKIRNKYLDLQKKKMKEFKQYLHKKKFSKTNEKTSEETDQPKEIIEENSYPTVEFTPGVIVKVKLPEPCSDVKKTKNDIKLVNPNVRYVDIPLPAGSEEIFVRFNDSQSAKEFCEQDFPGEKNVLENEDEKEYWKKIENDRTVKFAKVAKKQRGRDRLLKKAEKEKANHIRFEESETKE